jgi:SAM-dependent methyltransferase
MAQDSSLPDFWDTRYRAGVTPWDAGGVPRQLTRWLKALATARVLVPGCGAGYEVRAFAQAGHDVLGIEFSDAAIEAASRALGPLAQRVSKADYFAFETAPFDVVYERAFLCALPRRLWARWAERTAALVRPGGALAGFFFFDHNDRGPPFGVSPERLDELLRPSFVLETSVEIAPAESIEVFKGKERWQLWKRKL